MRCNGMKEVAIRYEKYMHTETRILGLSINFEEILERFESRAIKNGRGVFLEFKGWTPPLSLIPLTRSWKAYKYEALMDIKNIVIWIFFILSLNS